DDLPEVIETDGKLAGPLTVPVIANGRISKPGENDRWPFTARKGETVDIELRAQRLGSPLTGVLSIEDDKGKSLAKAEATAGGKSDPALRFAVPADGTYTVVVSERFRAL